MQSSAKLSKSGSGFTRVWFIILPSLTRPTLLSSSGGGVYCLRGCVFRLPVMLGAQGRIGGSVHRYSM
jgi:hypothetical protein